MSNNASGAANPQGSPHQKHNFLMGDPSETIRRAPLSKREIKAYLLGCLHDGTLNKGKKIRIAQKGRKWLEFLQELLKKLGYNSWIYKEGKTRQVYVLETLAGFLKFNVNPLQFQTKQEKIGYMRGLFDAEGGLPRSTKDKFYIQLALKDREKIRQIKECLKELGISTGKIHNPSKKIDPHYWRIYVLAESHKKFIQLIGSWHPRKIKILRERVKI